MLRIAVYGPHACLKPYVKCYWSLKSACGNSITERKHLLSDGGMKVGFNLADPVTFQICNRKASKPFEISDGCIVGPSAHNFWLLPSGEVHRIGVQFRPGGAYPFITVPANQLRDQFIDLETVWGVPGRRLREKIQDPENTTQERIRILERFLLQRLERANHGDLAFDSAVEAIISRKGQMAIGVLSKSMHLSNRQLERKFNHNIGISPKHLCRILRFRHIFDYISNHPNADWASVAAVCGYYDQSHLIRDFTMFSRLSPLKFINDVVNNDLLIGWGLRIKPREALEC